MTRIESYSSLSTLAECAHRYKLRYIDKLEAPGESLPAYAGGVLHEGFRSLYADGWDEKAAVDAVKEAWGDFKPPLGAKHSWLTRAFCEARIVAYMREREAHPTMLEEGTLVPGIAEEEHIFEWAGDSGVISVKVVLDMAVEINGGIWVVDNKCTTGWVNSHWATKFRIGNQARMYAAYLQQALAMPVKGALINAVYMGDKALDPPEKWTSRKSSPSSVIRLDFTQEQINESREWVEGLTRQRDAHAGCGLWPRNEMACNDFGQCEYLDLCSAPSDMVRRARMQTAFTRRTRA